jgi:hypothetical protein
MDPATALGVAAAAVQFIEVGLKTLALRKEIRDNDTDPTMLYAELQWSTKQPETMQVDRLQTRHTRQAFLQSLEHLNTFARHSRIEALTSGTFDWMFTRGPSQTSQTVRTMALQGRFSKWFRSLQPVF